MQDLLVTNLPNIPVSPISRKFSTTWFYLLQHLAGFFDHNHTMVSPLFDTKEKKRDSVLQDALVLSTEAREGEYMVGPKLFIVIGILSMACFLMLLDVSIIITVR